MSRFDVYELLGDQNILVLNVQADILNELNTRVVVPLIPFQQLRSETLPRLKPILTINQDKYVLLTTDIGVVTKDQIGERIENVEKDYRQEITEALDFLFQGF